MALMLKTNLLAAFSILYRSQKSIVAVLLFFGFCKIKGKNKQTKKHAYLSNNIYTQISKLAKSIISLHYVSQLHTILRVDSVFDSHLYGQYLYLLKRYFPSWIITYYSLLGHICINGSLKPAPHHQLAGSFWELEQSHLEHTGKCPQEIPEECLN